MRKLSLFVLIAALFSIRAIAALETEVPMVAGSLSFLESIFIARGNAFDHQNGAVFMISSHTDFITEMAVVEHNTIDSARTNVWGSYEGINTYTNNNTVN